MVSTFTSLNISCSSFEQDFQDIDKNGFKLEIMDGKKYECIIGFGSVWTGFGSVREGVEENTSDDYDLVLNGERKVVVWNDKQILNVKIDGHRLTFPYFNELDRVYLYRSDNTIENDHYITVFSLLGLIKKPKKPHYGLYFFSQRYRKKYSKRYPELNSSEISAILGQRWRKHKRLKSSIFEKCNKMVEADKKRYVKEMTLYNKHEQ